MMISMRSTSFGNRALTVAIGFVIATFGFAQKAGEVVLKQASNHPMRYYLSLPTGWKSGVTYPVIVAIESADRDFKANAEAFVKARGEMPFILVVPEVITNGGPRYREASGYSYSESDWQKVSNDGTWKFDQDGLEAIINDVHRLFGGETKYYLTGWEAGTHTVFAMAFNHPEKLKAVAPVCPNYQGRYVDYAPAGYRPRMRVFAGSADPAWAPGQPLFEQTKRAEQESKPHGFEFSTAIAKGKGHGPLAEEVLAWFRFLIYARAPR